MPKGPTLLQLLAMIGAVILLELGIFRWGYYAGRLAVAEENLKVTCLESFAQYGRADPWCLKYLETFPIKK